MTASMQRLRILNSIRSSLGRMQMDYREDLSDPQEWQISLRCHSGAFPEDVTIIIGIDDESFVMYFCTGVYAGEDSEYDLLRYLNLINDDSVVGYFAFTQTTKEIYYQLYIRCQEGAPLDDHPAETALKTGLDKIRRFGTGLVRLSLGISTPSLEYVLAMSTDTP